MTLVRSVPKPDNTLGDPWLGPGVNAVARDVDVWLDLVDDAEFVALPERRWLQVIDDCTVTTTNPPTRKDDGYIGFNVLNTGNATGQVPDALTPYGGVILFDGSGRLVSKKYAFKTYYHDANLGPPPSNRKATPIGNLLYRPPGARNGGIDPRPDSSPSVPDLVPRSMRPNPGSGPPLISEPPRSQFGFVLFDNEAYRSANAKQGSTSSRIENDLQFASGGQLYQNDPTEKAKEDWLDNNSTPLLVNRYNGTLVRGE
jgi:hypothetical protein